MSPHSTGGWMIPSGAVTHKFGIAVPKTVPEAYALDRLNGNTLWADAISNEMKHVRVAFRILSPGETAPGGYTKIPCHMIRH